MLWMWCKGPSCCKLPQHAERQPQVSGDAKVNSIAGDLLATANNYSNGGIHSLEASQLHEQMNDHDYEWDEATICHLAIDLAMNILSPQAGSTTWNQGGLTGIEHRIEVNLWDTVNLHPLGHLASL